MANKRKIKKAITSLLVFILVVIMGLITILLFPQPLFAYKVEYRQFSVYANEKISDRITTVLDSAVLLVQRSELYDPGYKVDIFLSYHSFYNTIDDKLLGAGPSARAIDNNLILKVAVDINKNSAHPTFHKPCETSFTYLIAHEMVHCLQASKYGILKFNPVTHPELWKLEGYPEYISRRKFSDPAYDLKNDIKKFIELETNLTGIWIPVEKGECEVPKIYYKSGLMTAYLMNIKKFSYNDLLNDTHPEEEIYMEMVKWMKTE